MQEGLSQRLHCGKLLLVEEGEELGFGDLII